MSALDQTVPVGYKQTEVGVIPTDWKSEQLGHHVEICSGESPSRFNFKSDGIPYFKVEQLNNHPVYAEATPYFIESTKVISSGSVIFPKRGASILSNKIRILKHDSFMDTNLMTLTCNESLKGKYLYNQLTYRGLDSVADTTSIPQINNKHIIPFYIPLPDVEEQTVIANALSDVDALLTELEKLIAKKQAIKTATMQQLLTGKTRLPQFATYTEGEKQGQSKGTKPSELGEIPEDWDVVKFDSLCKVFTKQTGFDYSAYIKPSLIKENRNGHIPFIQNKDFNAKRINYSTDYFVPESIALRFPNILLNEKSLLISISGSIGNVGIFDSENLAFIGGAIAIAKFWDQELIEWVMYYMLSTSGQNTLLKNVKAGSHQNLILDDIRQFEVPIPTKQEQTAITNILSDMDYEIQTLEQRLAKTRQIKQGMMQELLTGRTRLPFDKD